MGQVIAFANQKGGVAKTTSTYNVGVALAMKGKKTLIIDLDPQASLTISAGLEPLEQEQTIVTALKKERNNLKTSILPLMDNLDIVTSRPELAQLEMELIGRAVRETILKRALEPVRAGYDFILIDCPPQLSILTINALKNVFTMEKICSLLSYVNGQLTDSSDDLIDDQILYFMFVRLAARSRELYTAEDRESLLDRELSD